jgi:hypothetical protein
VLKDRVSRRCALDLTFDGGLFLGTFEDDDVWMEVRPRPGVATALVARHVTSAPEQLMAAGRRHDLT